MEDWFQRGRRDDTSHERKHAQYGGAPEGGAADSQHFTWWANPASDEPDRATKDDVGGEEDAGLRQVVEGRLALGQLDAEVLNVGERDGLLRRADLGESSSA